MYSLTLIVPEPDREQVLAELWEAGTSGVTETEDWLRAFFEDDSTAPALLARFRRLQPALEHEAPHDWIEESRKGWRPFPVGERFYLVPEWLDDPAPCGRVRLRMRPGLACGSGDHPATQLCLLAMERQDPAARSLLDVGTGSGILAEAAVLLGFERVFGCDIDPEAAAVAHANLAGAPRRVGLFAGSLRSVRGGAVDTIVANLNAATLRTLGGEARRVLPPGGTLIAAGFRSGEADKVAAAFSLPVRDRIELDDWTCLIF